MKTKITVATIIVLTISYATAFSQAPSKQWDARFGGSDFDALSSLAQTADGGYILGGYSDSGISGDKTQTSQGGRDYWIVKTDVTGVKQWDSRFGGYQDDFLTSIQQTADGGYILGGYSDSGSNGDKTQASQGGNDYWVVKTDANGVKQWDARFGGNSDDALLSLKQTTDGGYILGGISYSGISGDKTQPSQGAYDYWIVKTDASGVKQWDASFGGNSDDYFQSLDQTTDGGYILGGYSYSGISGDKTQASQGGFDIWIVKTDANGIKQWDARYGGSDYDNLASIRQTTDGGYILGGFSESGISGDKTQTSQGGFDYWIVKTDGNGVKQWDARFGGSSNDGLYFLQQTTDDGYILGGQSDSGISGDKTQTSQGYEDYWIVKTDANGMKQWDARFGGSNQDLLFSLQQTTDGGYILGGYTDSGISGDKTQASQGYEDYWIVKTDAGGAPACNIPTSLSTFNINASTANLKWEGVNGAIGYKVLYKVAGASQWSFTSSAYSHIIIIGLTPNTNYVWKVSSVCSSAPLFTSDGSALARFSTPPLRLGTAYETIFEIYPNPVSQSATISFSLNQASPVVMEILDVNGRSLRVIANEDFSAGDHEVIFNRGALSSGIYLLQIKTGEGVKMKKMLVE